MNDQYVDSGPKESSLHRVGNLLGLSTITIILFFMFLSTSASSVTIDENIIVDGPTSYVDETIVVTGNISIRDGGSLSFSGCDLMVNRSIYIDSGGRLSFDDCNLSLDIWYTNIPRYARIEANSSTILTMRRVQVSSEGWWSFGSGEEYRIIFFGDEFVMEDCVVNPSGLRFLLYGVDNVRINNSTFQNQDGITLSGCNNSSIRNSKFIAPWNSWTTTPITIGSEFIDCHYLEITNCTFSYYLYYPLWLRSCKNVVVRDCIIDCNHTKGDKTGVRVEDTWGLLLSNVKVARSTWNAIHLLRSHNVTLEDSEVMHSNVGVNLTQTHDFIITGCALFRNKLGIVTHNATGGTVYLNTFYLNKRDAVDDGGNYWDLEGRGNYWDSYEGTDGDGDGIGDVPHPVPNNTRDRYPLVDPYGLEPLRMVSSMPANGQTGVDPSDPVILEFNQMIDVDTVIDGISINPVHEITLNSVSGWANRWYVSLSMKPSMEDSTEYVLAVSTNLIDIFRRPLDREYFIVFTTFDTTSPSIELITPANGSWIPPGTPVEIMVQENILDYIIVDGGFFNRTFTGRDVTIPTDEWVDGHVNISVLAVDLAGNTAIASFSFIVDGTPPVLKDLSPVNGSFLNLKAVIEVTVDDAALALLQLETSWNIWTGEGSSLIAETAVWPEGRVECTVWATDIAGNEFKLGLVYLVDHTPPTVRLIRPSEGTILKLDAEIEVSIEDLSPCVSSIKEGDGECRTIEVIDGKVRITVEEGEDGPYPLVVYCVDAAGNEGSLILWYWLDISKPVIAFSPSRTGPLMGPGDVIVVTIEDSNLADLVLSLDGVEVYRGVSTTFKFPLSSLKGGHHDLLAIATDIVGHQSEESISFVMDRTPPRIDIHLPLYGPYFTNGSSVIVQVYELNSPISLVSIDHGLEQQFTCSSFSVALMIIESGWHRLFILTKDGAGNAANRTLEFMVDNDAPRISFIDLETGRSMSLGDEIQVTVEDALEVGTIYRFDDGPWFPLEGGSIAIPQNITEGTHKVSVRSTDLVGNTEEQDFSFVMLVKEESLNTIPSVVLVSIIIILVTIGLALFWWRKARMGGEQP